MSRENVDVVRASFEAWGRGDPAAALACFDEAVEWEIAEDEPDARTLHGLEEIGRWLAEWASSFEDFSAEGQDFIDAGDHVVVPMLISGRPRGGGPLVTVEETQVHTLRHGVIVRVREFRTQEEALQAVGLDA
jgi:ketosteroid isomerase-like protein